MNLIILGPQMSGKGTQAKMLVNKYDLNYVDMGSVLRSIAGSDNKYAKTVAEFTSKGQLVPDEFVRLIAWDHVNKQDKTKGFLFDGYPRSVAQYEHVVDMLKKFGKKVDYVFFINISEAEILRRISGRRICEKCGKIYNFVTGPKPVEGKCECGGELRSRSDDTTEATKNRLDYYKNTVMPLIEYLKTKGNLMEINGEQSIEKIHQEIVEKLGL